MRTAFYSALATLTLTITACTSMQQKDNSQALGGSAHVGGRSPASDNSRAFRVNSGEISPIGYAISWGVPGKSLDFENIEKSSADVDRFNNDPKMGVHNYLVNLPTNQIIVDLTAEQMKTETSVIEDYTIGGIHFGNHFSFSISDLVISDTDLRQNVNVVAVYENWKWNGGISHVYFIDQDQSTVLLDIKDFEQDFEKALAEKLTAFQKGVYAQGAKSLNLQPEKNSLLNPMTTSDDYYTLNRYVMCTNVPKSDKPNTSLCAEGDAKISEANGKLKIEIKSIKVKVQ